MVPGNRISGLIEAANSQEWTPASGKGLAVKFSTFSEHA